MMQPCSSNIMQLWRTFFCYFLKWKHITLFFRYRSIDLNLFRRISETTQIDFIFQSSTLPLLFRPGNMLHVGDLTRLVVQYMPRWIVSIDVPMGVFSNLHLFNLEHRRWIPPKFFTLLSAKYNNKDYGYWPPSQMYIWKREYHYGAIIQMCGFLIENDAVYDVCQIKKQNKKSVINQ